MTVLSFVLYTGDGGTGPFAVPFPYLDRAHVGVKVDGVAAAFTWINDSSVQLDAPAAGGAAVEVRRSTPREPLVDFTDGSILTEADLDAATLQQLYVSQEAFDTVENAIGLGSTGQFDADDRRIENLAAPAASGDAATKGYVDTVTGAGQAAAAAASAAAAAASEAAAETAETAAEAAQAAAEAAAAGVPSPPFDTADLADDAVTQAKIADDAVGFSQLLDATQASIIGANAAGAFGEVAKASQAEMEAGTETAIRAMSPEGVGQAIAALFSGAPVGSLCWFAADSPPGGYLECDGSAISRTTYADLFAAVGTVFGVGDGSTTFALPDLRGDFVRGWDNGRGVDSGRSFGSAQADELKAHTHGGVVAGGVQFFGGGDGSAGFGSTGSTGGAETRPRNIALLPCIKY